MLVLVFFSRKWARWARGCGVILYSAITRAFSPAVDFPGVDLYWFLTRKSLQVCWPRDHGPGTPPGPNSFVSDTGSTGLVFVYMKGETLKYEKYK